MTSFEFFTVLLSFVVSLGVASLLHAVIRLIQEAPRVTFSWTWTLWAAAIFNLQITFWLRSWTYHDAFALKVSTSLPPLLLAIIAFFACGLATPHIPEDGPIDLREVHVRHGRKYQLAFAVFMVVAIIQAGLMLDMASMGPDYWIDSAVQAAIAIVCLVCMALPNVRWLQVSAPFALLAAGIGYYTRLMAM